MKTLITFVHFNRPNNSLYRNNLDFFSKVGLTESLDHQFNFIINSKTGGENIPRGKNISVIQGHNKNQDWGAYQQSIYSSEIKEYDFFIFINDTCRGPFIPNYIPDDITWVELFLHKLNEKVKMVGPTWFNADECPWVKNNLKNVENGKLAHIQSYCFGVDKKAMTLLLENNKFDVIGKSWEDLVRDHEIGSSQLLLEKGYQIQPFQLSQYSPEKNRDISQSNKYFGININPLEVMFFKTIGSSSNDPITPEIRDKYTKWTIEKQIRNEKN